jgi:hypothetical protein
MNKMYCDDSQNSNDELASEYNFDYQRAKPNRFASRSEKEPMTVVVLDEDVAQVFTTPEAVNKILRALIREMPQAKNDEKTV